MRELRDLVAQLRADNERLRQEQAAAPQPIAGASGAPSLPLASAITVNSEPMPLLGDRIHVPVQDRLVFVPRDRKCPYFSGKSGVSVGEWVEEAQACMRARHLSFTDQAFFLFDHLMGEAREEIKYRPSVERRDPDTIIAILTELYGCSQSYVALQEAFFSRKQQEGETLQEFSLALMSLMDKVQQRAPDSVPNAAVLLRDQFTEHVLDGALRRELKQLVRRQPVMTLLEVRAEAIRWEREGMPGAARGRSHSLPSAHAIQYGVQGGSHSPAANLSQGAELSELKEMLKRQQNQLNQLTQSMASLQGAHPPRRPLRNHTVICRRCQQPGHYARECDREWVPSHLQSPSRTVPFSSSNRPPHSSAPAEN